MRFGVCCGPEVSTALQQAGFDFFEWSVPALLKPREPEEAFRRPLAQVRAAALPCEALNCLLPGDLKVTGPAVDAAALEAYMRTAMRRAGEAGVGIVVFGSGAARRAPDGFDRAQAVRQIVDFLKMAALHAAAVGVTLVVEPLNRAETNTINSVAEGAEIVRQVGHPAVRLLVDGFHLMRERESPEAVVRHAAAFAHMHVATEANRRFPGAEPCAELPVFLAAVRRGGYDGRISIEAGLQDAARDPARALAVLRGG